MTSRVLPEVNRLYRVPKPNIFSRGVPSQLPEAYKKFFEEWTQPKTPVHYRPEPGRWKRDPLTGEVKPVQNVPIPVRFPDEIHKGLWGGEGVIFGYKEGRLFRNRRLQETTSWWTPHLQRSVVHSEILDKRLSVIVTRRTIHLIIDHNGFDNYILETSTSDLQSLLALKLKKKMLLALFDKTLYPDDPTKQEEIYNKYKHHLVNYNKEDLEWYGLSIGEAVAKFQAMEDDFKPEPLKYQFRAEMIQELKEVSANNELETYMSGEKGESKSWLKKLNPFAKKT